ncbi:hypothetical protein KUL118_52410 [Tenacibaculum sp. KUL118]|jgi:hypothetical protein|nr:hypothetical protein KUL118_52410 [Tenacibaculum sp. KUL118]
MSLKRNFNPEFGVYCCNHVFSRERDVSVVIREGNDWQFLCGEDDDERCHLIHVHHLLDRDNTLEVMAELESMQGAMRIHNEAEWEYFELGDEE